MEQEIYNVFEDPGFRFKPSDAQKLEYLLRFVTKVDMRDAGFIKTDIDVYGRQEPWEIYSQGFHCGVEDGSDRSSYRYFITKLKKKGPKTYHRGVGKHGSWKQQDKGKPVVKGSKVNLGYKKSISYENKKLDTQIHRHWLMKEYELSSRILDSVCKDDPERRDWVLCAIKMKPQSSDHEFSTSTMAAADNFQPYVSHLQVAENQRYDTCMDQQQQGADSFAGQTVSQTLQDVPEACNSQQQQLEDWTNGFSMEFMDDKQQQGADSFAVQTETLKDVPEACNSQQQQLEDWINGFSMEFMDDKQQQQQDLSQLTYNWNDWDFVGGQVY